MNIISLHIAACRRFGLILLASLFAVTGVAAQPGQADEKPENLKVLPETMSMQQVRRVMFQFTSGLGVRCIHCHVGEEGQPMSTYDFASDEKEAKEVARAMMRMVGDINDSHIKTLPEGDSRLSVNCATCHHGVAKPQPLDDLLADYLPDHGVEETLMYYETLREQYYGSDSYDFTAGTLNSVAQGLLGSGEAEDALTFLELNADMHPSDANTHVLMGEAYVVMENMEAAIEHMEKALELNPNNRRLQGRLEELKGQ